MFEMIGRQAEVGLVPQDAPRMCAFYRDVLGLPIHSETPIKGGVNRRFLAGRTVVKHLCLEPAPQRDPRPLGSLSGLRSLTLALPGLAALAARARMTGARIVASAGMSGVRRLFVDDPDGNTVEIVALDDTGLEEAFAEVMIATSDPGRAIAFYTKALGRAFHGAAVSEQAGGPAIAWGPLRLAFLSVAGPLAAPDLRVGAAAGLRYLTAFVEDVEGLIHRAEQRSVHIASPPRRWTGGSTIAFIADPDGTLIEFGGPPRPMPEDKLTS